MNTPHLFFPCNNFIVFQAHPAPLYSAERRWWIEPGRIVPCWSVVPRRPGIWRSTRWRNQLYIHICRSYISYICIYPVMKVIYQCIYIYIYIYIYMCVCVLYPELFVVLASVSWSPMFLATFHGYWVPAMRRGKIDLSPVFCGTEKPECFKLVP